MLKAHCSLCHDYFTFVIILIFEKVCHEKDQNSDIHLKNKCSFTLVQERRRRHLKKYKVKREGGVGEKLWEN